MKFTGERAHGKSFWGDKRFADHYERYEFATKYCKDKKVLDIASGSGYGSVILARVAQKVTGLDVSEEAIRYCKENIRHSNLQFVLGNGKTIPYEDNSFDIVVSFETIEHIKDYATFLKEIKRVLKEEGTLIISTPNFKGEIRKNKYHISNFTTNSFIEAVKNEFTIKQTFFQGKHFYPFPGRGIIESLLHIKKDTKIYSQRPIYDHHVTLIEATKH